MLHDVGSPTPFLGPPAGFSMQEACHLASLAVDSSTQHVQICQCSLFLYRRRRRCATFIIFLCLGVVYTLNYVILWRFLLVHESFHNIFNSSFRVLVVPCGVGVVPPCVHPPWIYRHKRWSRRTGREVVYRGPNIFWTRPFYQCGGAGAENDPNPVPRTVLPRPHLRCIHGCEIKSN